MEVLEVAAHRLVLVAHQLVSEGLVEMLDALAHQLALEAAPRALAEGLGPLAHQLVLQALHYILARVAQQIPHLGLELEQHFA